MRYVTFFFSFIRKCSNISPEGKTLKALTDNRLTVKNVCSFNALFCEIACRIVIATTQHNLTYISRLSRNSVTPFRSQGVGHHFEKDMKLLRRFCGKTCHPHQRVKSLSAETMAPKKIALEKQKKH